MNETFETSENPRITLAECLGNLTIKGKESNEVTIQTSGAPEDTSVTQEEDTFVIKARGDCRITCPLCTTLTINTVRGDLKLREIQTDVTIGEVNGNASLRGVGPTTIAQVFGDLRVQQVAGDLDVQSVAGNARVNDVEGEATLARVGSDLRAEGLARGLDAAAVGSDVRLGPPFAAGATYNVRAGSDLVVKIPEDTSVRFTLQAGGGVRCNVPDLVLHEEDGTVSGVLGEGEATIEAQVGGSVILKQPGAEGDSQENFDFDFDFSFLDGLADIGPIIEARVADAMADLEIHLQESLQNIDGERIRMHIERAAEKAERAAERIAGRAQAAAEREAERARRHAEREAERARMRAEHAERRWQRASGYRPTPPPPPRPPTAPEPPTRTADEMREERLQVLRMVEQGKISAEEAANLLAALR